MTSSQPASAARTSATTNRPAARPIADAGLNAPEATGRCCFSGWCRSTSRSATSVMNVSTYAFTVLAAHLLGPKPYGAFASLMATLLVISVVQLGLQATAARRISAEPEHAHEVEAVILRVTYWAAALFGVLLL